MFTLESNTILSLLNLIFDLFDKFGNLVREKLQYNLSFLSPISFRIIVFIIIISINKVLAVCQVPKTVNNLLGMDITETATLLR